MLVSILIRLFLKCQHLNVKIAFSGYHAVKRCQKSNRASAVSSQ